MYTKYTACKVIYKKQKRKRGLIITCSVLFFLVLLMLLHYFLYMVPIIRKISDEKVRAFANSAVGRAAADIVGLYQYQDFVEVVRNADGDVVLIQANAPLVHAVTRSVAAKASDNISGINELAIEIPFGNLTGIALFAGRGPLLKVKALPVGVIGTSINSEFVSAGINQTLHRIHLEITADVNVILPGADSLISAGIPILIAESVIVGKVPNFYFSSSLLEQSLNLVP